MHLRDQLELDDYKYGLLFDVRRSVRYHERRMAFFEFCHATTSFFTILMAGSVLFDVGKDGETAPWLLGLSVFAAFAAALDMVVGYSKKANLHESLRGRFVDLEIDMVSGDTTEEAWVDYQRRRLMIERDEPPVYKVLDGLCRNEILIAEGFRSDQNPDLFFVSNCYQRLTSHLFRWENSPSNTDYSPSADKS